MNIYGEEIVGWRTDWTGKYKDADPVLSWSDSDNINWKTATTEWGNATPVIVGNKIFICSEPANLLCLNKADGKILWKKEYISSSESSPPKTHKVCGYSSMTPVSDGTNIYVVSGYGTAACFDLDGNRKWLKKLNSPNHKWGTSASPLITDNKLIVHIIPELTALDLKTGDQIWKTESKGTWGTPVVLNIGNQDAVYTTGGDLIRASDGKLISNNTPLPWTCPITDGKKLFIVDKNGAFALELPSSLEEGKKMNQLWNIPATEARNDRYYASPVIHEGLLYAITRKGHFMVIDAEKGELIYEKKLDLGGTTYPSILLAGKYLLVSSDTGKTAVLKPGREFSQIGINNLENFRSTPIFEGNLMYIRGLKNLYCIGKK